MDRAELDRLDAKGYEVLDALAYVRPPLEHTLATPHAFVAIDGVTYWVKANAQRGLVNELIGGRLASKVGVGPMARVVRVPAECLPTDGSAQHLRGMNVGLQDISGTVNARELQHVGVSSLDPAKVSSADRALVVAFHTWTATSDAQVLLNMHSGRVHTIDFGDSFSEVSGDPSLVVLDLPGLPHDHGTADAEAACAKVESISDDDLLTAVAAVPWGDGWGSSPDTRLELAERLADRRSNVRTVMKSW
jgi:hypothetical protein